jgi:hypothetical protein
MQILQTVYLSKQWSFNSSSYSTHCVFIERKKKILKYRRRTSCAGLHIRGQKHLLFIIAPFICIVVTVVRHFKRAIKESGAHSPKRMEVQPDRNQKERIKECPAATGGSTYCEKLITHINSNMIAELSVLRHGKQGLLCIPSLFRTSSWAHMDVVSESSSKISQSRTVFLQVRMSV